MIDRLAGFPRAVVLLAAALLTVAGCDDDEHSESPFCRQAGEAATRLEQAHASLAEAAQGLGPTDLETARAEYAAALNGTIEALQRPPAEIRPDAAAAVDGLRQQLSTVGDVQPGSPPAAFPPDRQPAASRVDSYLRGECEIAASLTPR